MHSYMLDFYNIVYWKKSFPSKESDTKDLTEYILHLRSRHSQLCEVHEVYIELNNTHKQCSY